MDPETKPTGESVSYTHLDVYKRQSGSCEFFVLIVRSFVLSPWLAFSCVDTSPQAER